MSINKKILLGKAPIELGVKDAVHTAIVSLRAGMALKPADQITMNSANEAIRCTANDSFGIVDPFLTAPVARGTMFWGVLKMDEVPNVQHHWDHPQHTFSAPTTEAEKNKYLERYAERLGITYDALMKACQTMVESEEQTPYSGPLDSSQFDNVSDNDVDDIWYEWANESGHEFYNNGTECCPEYDYPDCPFIFVAPEITP